MKTISKSASSIALTFMMSIWGGAAFAASSSGQITFVHLNSGVAGRDVCIRMVPTLPGSGWACLYNSNPLRSQIAELVLHAYEHGKHCGITWNTTAPEGHANIAIAECGNTQ
jgi:hypothetical protein